MAGSGATDGIEVGGWVRLDDLNPWLKKDERGAGAGGLGEDQRRKNGKEESCPISAGVLENNAYS